MNTELVLQNHNDLFTTSLLVSEKFKKPHKTTIRKIENLTKDTFSRLKIVQSDYIDERGKIQKMYLLNRDAFLFVAMGFTGNEAEKWKLDFIDAFNKMEELIKRQYRNLAKENWQKIRKEAAIESKLMCRTLEEVRKLEGKATGKFNYMNEHKLVNFAMTGFYKGINRNDLDEYQLTILAALEVRNAVLIGAGVCREDRKEALVDLYEEILTAAPTAANQLSNSAKKHPPLV